VVQTTVSDLFPNPFPIPPGFDPTRLCCGNKESEHTSNGKICPDGLVWCCICFHRFPVAELTTDPDGCKVNVCMNCTIDEAYTIERLGLEHAKRGVTHGNEQDGAGTARRTDS